MCLFTFRALEKWGSVEELSRQLKKRRDTYFQASHRKYLNIY